MAGVSYASLSSASVVNIKQSVPVAGIQLSDMSLHYDMSFFNVIRSSDYPLTTSLTLVTCQMLFVLLTVFLLFLGQCFMFLLF